MKAAGAMDEAILTKRWSRLRYHQIQSDYFHSEIRIAVVPSGRRSGKTEIAKRYTVMKALGAVNVDDWFVCSAPTQAQAKRIYWRDLKLLTPKWAVQSISESELTIRLVTGVEITVLGLDEPARIEGRPLSGIVLDESANMKPDVWETNVRPALADRKGWARLIGVPEGRNHYYDLWERACARDRGWEGYHWVSADILDPEEIEEARRTMDESTFRQEFEGSFETYTGLIYWPFEREAHAQERQAYSPNADLIFAFDFNVTPGVCPVLQEGPEGTRGIGEVHIPKHSHSERVCRRLAEDWGHHTRDVWCYGDATGGARGTAKVKGSDWEIIGRELRKTFGNRLHMDVPKGNPPERARINAVNSRLKSAAGDVRIRFDPIACRHTVKDFEAVRVLEGTAGEIDKKFDLRATHHTDAVGYYLWRRFPVTPTELTIDVH